MEEGLSKEPNEVVPYKILPFALESVEEVARSRLVLFSAVRGRRPMDVRPEGKSALRF